MAIALLWKTVSLKVTIGEIQREAFAWHCQLSIPVRDVVESVVRQHLNENKEEIKEKALASIDNRMVETVADNWFRDQVERTLPAKIADQVSESYLKDNLPEIVGKLDISAVSNAVLLRLTSKVLGTTTHKELGHYDQ